MNEILYSKRQRVIAASLRTACRVVRINPEVAKPLTERLMHYAYSQNKSFVLMALSALLRMTELKNLPSLLALLEYAIANASEDLVIECLEGFSYALKKHKELEYVKYLKEFWKASNEEGVHSNMLIIIEDLISLSDKHRERIIEMLIEFLNDCTSVRPRNEVRHYNDK